MEKRTANVIDTTHSNAKDVSDRGGKWVAVLIALIGIILFTVALTFSEQTEESLINNNAQLHIASSDKDDINTVMQLEEVEWEAINGSSFAFSSKAHWFSVDIPPSINEDSRLIEVSYSNLDFVDLWFVDKNQGQALILSQFKAGDNYPFSQRLIRHDQLVFPVPNSTSVISLYLRIETQGRINVPIKLWQEEEYIQFIASHRVFIGIFYGFMTAMALISLFLFVTSRSISTLLYTGIVLCLSFALASSQGLGYRFLWPESVPFQEYAVLFFAASAVLLSSAFAAEILEIKSTFKKLYRFFNIFGIIVTVYIGLIFILPFSVMVPTLALIAAIGLFLLLGSTIYIGSKGNSVASYLSAAWCSLLLGGLLGLADSLVWISPNLDPSYLMMVGAVIAALFMALGLAERFNTQRLAAKRVHLKTVENKQKAKQAKDELLRLQIEAKEKLEQAVRERNYELAIAIRELNEANQELERKTSIDALTGVASRRLYDKKVLAEARRSRREKTPLAIAMIDIDHFKMVNDTYGHHCGDAALKHFSAILQECIKRPTDTICRYGGEEFVVILPNTDLEGARILMENLRSSTEKSQFDCEGKTIQFTISVGVSTRVIVKESEYELLHAFSDKLLYKAKEAGRNQVMSAEFSH